MFELIAQGPTVNDRWRRPLPDEPVELGRSTRSHRVPWDRQVSRRHVCLTPAPDHVQVKVLSEASNPVFYSGDRVDSFELRPGEHFVIGTTTFLLTDDRAAGSMEAPDPVRQRTFSSQRLHQIRYADADRRIAILNRLPQVIANADNRVDLLTEIINLLMAGIPSATTIGLVMLTAGDADSDPSVEVIHWDRRGLERGGFWPSISLVRQAQSSNEPVLNQWQSDQLEADDDYTFDYEHDWAFVCPMTSPATPHWGIYVAGRNRGGGTIGSQEATADASASRATDVAGDIKFCELIASTLKQLLHRQQLERQQAGLRAFFSPVVVEALRQRDPETVLAPRKCEVSVLFCDLRGFSRTSEQMSDDLLGLLDRVSQSLGVMTSAILDAGGVIGDFHGDAVMGFWGWPLDVADPHQTAQSAVRAALAIESKFAPDARGDQSLEDFRIGLGMASGPAVAGKIGTADQVKVTVFGPVVNLASRLEGMTRQWGANILVDDTTAQQLAGQNWVETRRLGRVRPQGMNRTVDLIECFAPGRLPPEIVDGYQQGLLGFEQGEWHTARSILQPLAKIDEPTQFLLQQMGGSDAPPEGFDGVIEMSQK